ncbi:hypothetical protein BOVATA_004810 [Babesia ovata]|uniref:Uncharacterized protein n=1 Tax=Babesia ovata TaxID=189622 RepID=A0A2H6K7N4_9APIC|nr:uncharacterized protein BOVATA_004810 [Babesia ovata]GBE58988.1 hypothetical protein BOVATA_004810 [Babesia ovata]
MAKRKNVNNFNFFLCRLAIDQHFDADILNWGFKQLIHCAARKLILQLPLLESVGERHLVPAFGEAVAQAVVPVVGGELAYFVVSPVGAAFGLQVAKRIVSHRDHAQQHLGVLVGVSIPALRARVCGDVSVAELSDEFTEATADSVQQRSCDLTEGFGLHFTQRLNQIVEQTGESVIVALYILNMDEHRVNRGVDFIELRGVGLRRRRE